MYKIYICDLGEKIGIRPVVSVKRDGDICQVYEITKRNKDNPVYIRMNNYKIYGYCKVIKRYYVPVTNFKKFVRNCTKSEEEAIKQKVKSFGIKGRYF